MKRAVSNESLDEKHRSSRFASIWLTAAIVVAAVVIAVVLVRIYGSGSV